MNVLTTWKSRIIQLNSCPRCLSRSALISNYCSEWDHWDQQNASSPVNWTYSGLLKNIKAIELKTSEGKGHVYFAKDEVPSLWNHYATHIPGYFNSYDSNSIPLDEWPERDPAGCKLLSLP